MKLYQNNSETWKILGYLAVLMLFVLGISYFFLSKQSLRLDESQSLWQSSHTIFGVFNTISHDVHVPLYGQLLHFWLFLFGTSVTAARAMSLIFFLASIPAIYFLAKTAYGRSIGLFAALLLATSPFLNWYGNEIRMYSLLTLVTILNQFFFLKIFLSKDREESTSLWWWGYALTALVGIYTHYFFWLVLLAETIFFFLHYKEFPKKTLAKLSAVAVLLVAAIAPWLWYVKTQNGVTNSIPSLTKPGTVDLFNAFSQFLFGFQDDHINTVILSLWPITVILGFLSLRKKNGLTPTARFFLLSALLPIIVAFVVSIFYKPIFSARYLILATPALYIFLSWFLSSLAGKLAMSLKIILIVIMLATLYQQAASAYTPAKENYQQASTYIASHASPSDIVVLSAPFTIYPFEYYYKGNTSITTIPMWNPYVTGSIPPFSQDGLVGEVNDLKTSHNKIYLLLSYDQGYQNDVFTYFETHFQRLDHKNFSPGLDLYVYQLRY